MTTEEAVSSDPLIGTTLADRYEVQERIGSGAMGAVYSALQTGLGREVALKVLKRDLTWGGDTIARFRREAKAMSALTHPNTVQVYDFGSTQDGKLFLAMELLRGELATDHLMRTGPLPIFDAIKYVQQVLRSVSEAHDKGIIHRDLKPDNIFLADDDQGGPPRVKVLDFGIAKAIEGDNKLDQFETQDGTVFGTPRYMSPEQAQGRRLDHRSDLYGVGIMLYEFLTGTPPFVDADAVIVMAKHIRELPEPLSKKVTDRVFPASLERVVQRALAKSPEERFESAVAFDEALEQCLDDAMLMDRFGKGSAGRLLRKLLLPKPVRYGAVAALLALGALLAWPSTDTPAADGQAAPGTVDAADAVEPAAASSIVVKVESVPDGADVWRDGEVIGVTPLDVTVPSGEHTPVRLTKDGFDDVTAQLDESNLNPRIALSERAAADAPPEPSPVVTAEVPQLEQQAPPSPTSSASKRKAAARKRARLRRLREKRRKSQTAPKNPGGAGSPYEKF